MKRFLFYSLGMILIIGGIVASVGCGNNSDKKNPKSVAISPNASKETASKSKSETDIQDSKISVPKESKSTSKNSSDNNVVSKTGKQASKEEKASKEGNTPKEEKASKDDSSTTKSVPSKLTAGASDHVMFGGTPSRNMVNLIDKNISAKFTLADNLKWKSQVGSRAYGGPIIVAGKVLCGTNNENPRNPRDRGKAGPNSKEGPPIDKGVVMCFNEADGNFLWQAVHDKLPSGMVNDWPHEGVCSTSCVVDNMVYYVTNRCSVVCLDLNGLKDGNQGVQKEKYATTTDADILWEYDMMKELNVFPHNMAACSPLVVGDIIFVTTANGVDENHINIPSPESPSFIALNRKTGKLLWKSNLPGRSIMHGQWSNPTYGVIKGKAQVIFPGGDGWLYSFKPETGDLIWKFDANPKDARYDLGGKGTKSDFIGTPVVYKDRVYIGTGQDPEHYEGIGHFWCIDGSKEGDISPDLVEDSRSETFKIKKNPNSGAIWEYGGKETRANAKRDYVFGRTMSTACIVDDIIYISELAGYLHCIDANTGKKYWQYDLKSSIWGSAYYADGKVFIGNEDGDLFVFKHEAKPQVLDEVQEAVKAKSDKETNLILKQTREKVAKQYLLNKTSLEEAIRSTPIIANGTLYILTEKNMMALKVK